MKALRQMAELDTSLSGANSVGVVIVTATADRHLLTAVMSVLGQTLPPDRVIVVFDGCAPIGLPIRPGVQTVVLHSPERQGIAASRNSGLNSCLDLTYTAVLDGDDYAQVERLAEQVGFLADHPDIDVLGTAVQLVEVDGAPIGSRQCRATDPKDLLRSLVFENPLVHSSVLMRMSAVSSVGGYDVRCAKSVDYDLWLRLALAGHQFACLDRLLTNYRLHPGQISRQWPKSHAHLRIIARNRLRLARRLNMSTLSAGWSCALWTLRRIVIDSGIVEPQWRRGITRVESGP